MHRCQTYHGFWRRLISLWVLKEITHFCLSLIFYVTITYCRLSHYYVTFNLCNINFGNRLKSKAVVIKTAFRKE